MNWAAFGGSEFFIPEGIQIDSRCPLSRNITEWYHYYGIAVKESSQYYDVMYSKKGAAWVSETGKKEVSKQTVAYSPRSKLGTLLPEFPNVKDLNLPASLPEEKVSTFIMMYRTHCQRILDTVIRANFDEVQSFLLHFWQGMPPHMLPVLGSSTVVNIVGVCDSILYKAISGVLMPTVLQALPDSLTQVIRKFAKQLDEWLKVALHDLPENLRNIKFELSRRFSQILRRQTSLNHLCQASRTVIHSADITFQMLEDWRNVDLNSITKQTLYTMEDSRYQFIPTERNMDTREAITMGAMATSILTPCRASIRPSLMTQLSLGHSTMPLTTGALHRPSWSLVRTGLSTSF
uniref:Regulatory factor X4 n=1 Tax=Gorilla gorilla gorilla TaxID=9595 RepID=A0A2I2ZTJ5_GORGO